MKNIFLFRHGKSDWKNDSVSDHDRPLSPRGIIDVPKMSKILVSKCSNIHSVLCSDSLRTRQSFEIMKQTFIKEPKVTFLKELYLASLNTIFKSILNELKTFDNILIIAHNPGLNDIINFLDKTEIMHFPTSALAHLSINNFDNGKITIQDFKILSILKPKELFQES